MARYTIDQLAANRFKITRTPFIGGRSIVVVHIDNSGDFPRIMFSIAGEYEIDKCYGMLDVFSNIEVLPEIAAVPLLVRSAGYIPPGARGILIALAGRLVKRQISTVDVPREIQLELEGSAGPIVPASRTAAGHPEEPRVASPSAQDSLEAPQDLRHTETKFGQVTVAQRGDEQKLLVNGTTLSAIGDWSVDIEAQIEIANERLALLISECAGGNSVEPDMRWVVLSNDEPKVSGRFGTGARLIGAPHVKGGELIVDFASHLAGVKKARFVTDPDTMRITEIIAHVDDATAEPAGAGDDCTRWIGKHPTDVFNDASERARFAKIMSADQMQSVMEHMLLASHVERVGNFVIGGGMMPHTGNDQRAAWALNVRTGQPIVVCIDEEVGKPTRVQTFGGADIPACLKAFVKVGILYHSVRSS